MTREAAANDDERWPAPSPSSGLSRRLVKPLVTICLYVIIFYRFVDERALLSHLASTDLALVAAGVAVYSLGQLLSTLKWQLLLRPVALEGSFGQLAGFYFTGMFFNNFLPTIVGGDAVKAMLLASETHAPARSAMSVFMERNLGLAALLTIATLAAALAPRVADPVGIPLVVWALALSGGFVIVNLALANVRWYGWLDSIVARLPLGGFRPKAASLYDAIVAYKRAPATVLTSIFLSFIFQAIVIVVVFLNVRALGFEDSVPISALAVIVPLVSLAGMLPVSVNGLGVRDYLYIQLLAQFGVPAEGALSLALLYFVVTLTASLPGGLVYAFRRPASLGRSRRVEEMRRS